MGGALAFFGIIHQGAPVVGGEMPTAFLIAYGMVALLFLLKWALDKRDPDVYVYSEEDDKDVVDLIPTAAVATASTSSDPVLDGTERAGVVGAERNKPGTV